MRAIKAWRFLGAISLASALASAQAGHASSMDYQADADERRAVAVADTFLLRVEQGQLESAHGMLIREARAVFRSDQLAPRRPFGRRGGFVRRYRSSAEVSREIAFAGWGHRLPGRFTYRIICYVETPIRGSGRLNYVWAIVRRVVTDQVWFPVIYRIESSRSVHCPS